MRLCDSYALAAFLGIRPVTIRQWAHRGKIQRQGNNPIGWALYDAHEVLTYAKTRGYPASNLHTP